MSDDDEISDWQRLPPEKRQHAIEIKQKLGALISEYLDTIRTDEDEYVTTDDRPFIQAWVIGCEWTNIRLEQEDKGGRDAIAPEGQTISNSLGLAAFITNRYG